MKKQLFLKTLEDIKDFVSKVSRCPYDVDLLSGRYVIDAKSIMGIFSLDLDKPIYIRIHSQQCGDFLKSIAPYLAKTDESV